MGQAAGKRVGSENATRIGELLIGKNTHIGGRGKRKIEMLKKSSGLTCENRKGGVGR